MTYERLRNTCNESNKVLIDLDQGSLDRHCHLMISFTEGASYCSSLDMRLKLHYRQPQRRPYHLETKCWISSENQRIALVPWIIVNLLALQIAKSVQDQMEVVEESVA